MDWKGRKIEAVIFDMDGVLIDSEPLWKIAEVTVFTKLGLNLTAKNFEQTVGLRIDQVVEYWRNRFPWTQDISNDKVVDDIVNLVAQLVTERGEALPGVFDILEWLKTNNIKLGVGTSSYMRIVDAVMDKLNVAEYFEVIHSAEYEKYGKPHPGVYLTCAQKLGVSPDKCLVIEDSFNGLLAAKAASMATIVVPDKSNTPHPHLIIADLVADSLDEVCIILSTKKGVQ